MLPEGIVFNIIYTVCTINLLRCCFLADECAMSRLLELSDVTLKPESLLL